jgi:hypothetical protein
MQSHFKEVVINKNGCNPQSFKKSNCRIIFEIENCYINMMKFNQYRL